MNNSKKAVKAKEVKRAVLEVKYFKGCKITKKNVSKLLWDAVALDVLMGGEEESGIKEILEYAKSIKDKSSRQEIVDIISCNIKSILTGIEYTVEYIETVKEKLEEFV